MSSATNLLAWMRAAGEPSRLRLLALCSEREISVTELARALKQSGPRVSRHLKILCEAGLLERLRQGQWVHYQLSKQEGASKFVRGLLAQLSRDDAVFVRDRQHAREAESVTAPATTSGSRLGRTMRAFIDSSRSSERVESTAIIGARHMELLEAAAGVAAQCVAVMPSRRAAQAARAYIETHELPCHTLLSTPLEALKNAGTYDAVIIEHLHGSAELGPLLAAATAAVSHNGRLWLFTPYEALEGPRDRVVEHPLARLRRLLSETGLTCQQLRPIEADGEHVLAAVAVRTAASQTHSVSAA